MMKQGIRRITAAVLCIVLLAAIPAQAAELGEPVDVQSTVLAPGAVLTEQTYWTGSDRRTEHYLTLTPDSSAVATVVSGDTLWSRRSVTAAAAALEARGLHPLCGENGGFYTVATGEPVGLVVSGGVLRADGEGLQAVGFTSDGDTLMGDPGLTMALTWNGGSLPIAALNHKAGPGLRLYTADCAAAVALDTERWCLRFRADGQPTLSGSLTLTLERVEPVSDSIRPAAGEVLALLDRAEGEEAPPAAFQVGERYTLKTSCAPGWEQVDSAVGILYPLVADGKALPGLEAAAAPRTAVGLRQDGTLILYTVDGRQSGYSVGTGLAGVARRMAELGCVSAGALDGGGSTLMAAQAPGSTALDVVNRPSDGAPRSVVNYIFAAVPARPTGAAAQLALQPGSIHAVTGAEITLRPAAVDENGYPAALPAHLSYTVSGGVGYVRDGVFHAEAAGSGSVTLSAPGVGAAVIPVRVVSSPEQIALYGEVYGRLTTALTLEPGQEVDLTVRAEDHHVLLTGDDRLYTWSLEPETGTVDGTGHIIPADVSGSGLLRVSMGDSRVEIPITVWSGVPFRDVGRSDEYFDAVKYVYDNGIFEGVSDTEFAPGTVMNRAMLVTVLWRMSGRPAAKPAAFGDVQPEEWYGPAVDWAAEAGLVEGYSDTVFGPLDDLTLEQILTIFHRWAGLPEAENPDAPLPAETQSYAAPALRWALEQGLVLPEELQPAAGMTRAGVARTLLRRSRIAVSV